MLDGLLSVHARITYFNVLINVDQCSISWSGTACLMEKQV